MKAWLQRNADYFKRALVFGIGLRQLELGGIGVFEQRNHARFHILVGNAPAFFPIILFCAFWCFGKWRRQMAYVVFLCFFT